MRRKHHIGRLRIKAAKFLTRDFGFEVLPEHIDPASGYYRTDIRADVYRWELFTRDTRNGMPIVAGCWETLTSFVKLAASNKIIIDDGEITFSKDSCRLP